MDETRTFTTSESLSTSESRAAIVTAVFALLSTLAFVFIVFRIIRLARALFLEHDDSITSRPPEILLFRTPLGRYAGCLILSNMFISVAGLINFSWGLHSGFTLGITCSAQGVLMQIGLWGTCWFTAAHGLHTLSSLGFHIRPPRWHSWAGLVLGWVVAFIAGLAPLLRSDVYGPAGATCGVTISFPVEIFVLEAFPILLGALVSSAVYSVIFVVLRRKLGANFAQKPPIFNLTSQKEDERNEGYYRFICIIVRSMFWFPFAFLLLCLPFCITHILMSAGYVVPFAATAFAEVCISMLGLVNVGLLCNTLRVIAPICFGPRAVVPEGEKTFGNDASGESPIIPPPRPTSLTAITSHEGGHVTYNSMQSFSHHSRASSSSSANSNTALLGGRPSRKSTRAKVAPFMLKGAIPPTRLGQQLSGDIDPLSWQNGIERRVEPLTLDENSPLPTMADTSAIGEVSPTLNLSSPEVKTKSIILAAQLDIGPSSQSSVFLPAQELETTQATVYAIPATPMHRLEGNFDVPATVAVPTFIPSSPASTAASSADGDSDYFWEIVRAYKTRPLSRIQESDDECELTSSYRVPSRLIRTPSCRASVTTVWSQETGYTLSLHPDSERGEAYRQMVANAIIPGVMLGDRADVGEVVSRPAAAISSTPSRRPRPLLRPIQVASKVSAHLSSMLSPRLPSTPPLVIIGPNDDIV